MIGIVLAPMATGSSTSRALAQRAVANPAHGPERHADDEPEDRLGRR